MRRGIPLAGCGLRMSELFLGTVGFADGLA
jgi:hypothetical protein